MRRAWKVHVCVCVCVGDLLPLSRPQEISGQEVTVAEATIDRFQGWREARGGVLGAVGGEGEPRAGPRRAYLLLRMLTSTHSTSSK